ncbi:MAG: hypothetical protein PUF48_03735 [Oscillospiraceae bacterium]|nr:hypothetical protein [Oscillospiraceae bacterium]
MLGSTLKPQKKGEIIIEKKTERIKFWLSDKELKQIDGNAKKLNLNRSEYIRLLIENCQVVKSPDINYDDYYTKFKMLGDEINNYKKMLNSVGIFNAKDVAGTCKNLLKLMKILETEITEKMRIEIQKTKGGLQ